MSHVLVVSGGLLVEPDWGELAPGCVPDRLARRLTRSRRDWQSLDAPWSDGAAHLAWLARAFGVPGDPPACAAFAWQAAQGTDLSGAQAGDVWFCEPVHLSLEPERTVLVPIDAPPLTEQETHELFDAAAASARDLGAQLRRAGGRWYLFPQAAWELRTTALQAALGASIEARLPQGRNAAQWRRLMNEVQMSWHASRVNREREERGQQVANGLWLHGGGAWCALDRSRFARIHSDDPVVLGWHQAAAPAPQRQGGSDALSVWTGLFEPYWRRDWSAWAAAWADLDSTVETLLEHRPDAGRPLELVICGRRGAARFVIDRGTSLLPWRRRSLRECLLEPSP